MKVVTGTKTANGRVIEVELEDADGYSLFPEVWEFLAVDKKFKKLSAYADMLVLQCLLRDQEIHPDYFKKRITELAKELK